MKHDHNLPSDSELEARIVAWVLGEASPFEIAELERHIAAEPALAVFKRRIEAVHGLVQQANRLPSPELRLSPERRAKLLATIGAAGETPATPQTEVLYPLVGKRTRWKVPVWAYSAAACLMLGLFVAAELTPRYGSAIKPHWQESEGAPIKQEQDAVESAVRSDHYSAQYKPQDEVPSEVARRRKEQVERRQYAETQKRRSAARTEVSPSDKIVLSDKPQFNAPLTWAAPAPDLVRMPGSPPAGQTNYYDNSAPAAKVGGVSNGLLDRIARARGETAG